LCFLVICFVYFNKCYFFISLIVVLEFISRLEMFKFGSWMCFVSPQIMYYFKLSMLWKWSSICSIYFAEHETFTRHDNQHYYLPLKLDAFGKETNYRRPDYPPVQKFLQDVNYYLNLCLHKRKIYLKKIHWHEKFMIPCLAFSILYYNDLQVLSS